MLKVSLTSHSFIFSPLKEMLSYQAIKDRYQITTIWLPLRTDKCLKRTDVTNFLPSPISIKTNMIWLLDFYHRATQ